MVKIPVASSCKLPAIHKSPPNAHVDRYRSASVGAIPNPGSVCKTAIVSARDIARGIIDDLLNNLLEGKRGSIMSIRTEDTLKGSSERRHSLMTQLMRAAPDQRSKSLSYIVPPLEDDPRRQKLKVRGR